MCTLIEESEALQCQAAAETAALLTAALPELRVGLLHGRMKGAEKEQIMTAFKAGDLDLTICLEPLSPAETDFINTVAEGNDAAGPGSEISIKAGDYHEAGSITFFKRGLVTARDGSAVVH